VASLIRYRLQHERYIHRVAEAVLPTRYGDFRMIAYESEMDGAESHVALVYGDAIGSNTSGQVEARAGSPARTDPLLVRVHTHCLAGDVFGATLCDCRELVDNSLRMIAEAGRGALVYLHNGARGFTIDRASTSGHDIHAPSPLAPHRVVLHRGANRESKAKDPSEERNQLAQRILRQIGLGGQILSDLGIRRIRLLTNTPTHIPALQGFGIEIVEQVRVPLAADVASIAR
jgi:3,4-dihydroxy 2-butanone 4-phosphate synthase/GTP cyclohydrolase II